MEVIYYHKIIVHQGMIVMYFVITIIFMNHTACKILLPLLHLMNKPRRLGVLLRQHILLISSGLQH